MVVFRLAIQENWKIYSVISFSMYSFFSQLYFNSMCWFQLLWEFIFKYNVLCKHTIAQSSSVSFCLLYYFNHQVLSQSHLTISDKWTDWIFTRAVHEKEGENKILRGSIFCYMVSCKCRLGLHRLTGISQVFSLATMPACLLLMKP